jgi:uncharacterized protein (TIGR03437 family)
MAARHSCNGCFHTLLVHLMLASSFLVPVQAQQISAVVSAASDQPVISPNSLATIFGANLAPAAASAQVGASGALPAALGGTTVSIGGKSAPLLYVSPQQINFLVPADTPLGQANVSVQTSTSSSAVTGSASVALVSPGLFTIPCLRPSRGAVQNGVTYSLEPFQTLTQQNPIADKRTRLSLFGTGLRYAGSGGANVANAITIQATDSLGATHTLSVEYAGPAPIYPGLDQVNVVLPAELEGAGLVNLELQAGNASSNSVSIVLSQPAASGTGLSSGQSFNIMTVAGSGPATNTGNSGSAIGATIQNPTGVVLDKHHNLYIASASGHQVRMVSPDGTITTVAGTGISGSSGDGGPANQALLRTPVSLAADASGNLYIADSADNRIRRIAADGTMSTFAGTGIPGFSGDGGLATAAQLSSPSAVAIDAHGALVVADTGNNRIRKITSDGVIDTVAGTGMASFSGDGGAAFLAQLNVPDSVAVGADGTIYFADEGNSRVRRIAADGNISSLVGDNSAPLSFQSPIRVAVDANQQLFVSDSANARIQVMGSACQLNSVAGTGAPGFAGDGGPASSAQMNGPSSLAPDASGDVFFADSNNNRVRRLYQGDCDSPASMAFDPSPAMSGMTVNALVRLSCPAGQDAALTLSGTGNSFSLPNTVNIAAGQSSGNFSFQVPDVDTTTGFQVTASSPQYSATGTLLAEPAGTSGVLSMVVAPSSQTGGGPVTGFVRLARPAPAGGTTLSVASNNKAAQVTGDASIPEGQIAAEFAVATSPVTEPTTATITGNSGAGSNSAALTILPGANTSGPSLAAIGGVSISPASVTSGQSATGTVTLASAALVGGVTVDLSSNSSAASVPGSVTIPAGQSTATFPVSAFTVSSPTSATITASSANTASAMITINPASGGQTGSTGQTGSIASFSVSPSSVTSSQSSTGTVILASAAPAGGVAVGLSSNSSAASVPGSVTIPAGQTTATFPVSTSTVSSPTSATITASSANRASAVVTVNPASDGQTGPTGSIASFSVSPSSVTSGQSATGTVTLASAAPTGGVAVSLSSNSSAASVPGSVIIPAGQTTATFPVSTSTVSSPTSATITASAANTAAATVTVNPAAAPACVGSVTLSRSEVIGGNNVSGTVALKSPAPAGGQPVSLSSSSSSASVPTQVTVPAGQNSAGFNVTTSPVLSIDNPVISATTGACAGANTGLTLLPVALP